MKGENTSENRLQQQFEGFIKTSPLWEGHRFGITQFAMPKQTEPIFNGEVLSNKLYLGKRAERFLEDFLNQSKRYDVLASNIQIIDDKKTLGELDFIIYDNQKQQHIHLEQVYKFYVYDPRFIKETDRWIGPNRKDSLQEKIDKLNLHQFPLLRHPTTQKILGDLNISTKNIAQQVCFKAHCFVPKGMAPKDVNSINPKSISGYYTSYTNFIKTESKNAQYVIPKKIDWSIAPQNAQSWCSFSEICDQLGSYFKEKRAPLVLMKDGDTYQRMFVVWW